jgi:glycosyltransferase involved in cell wall biosynthesis
VILLSGNARDVPGSWKAANSSLPRVIEIDRFSLKVKHGRHEEDDIAHIISTADALHLHEFWDLTCLRLAQLARNSGTPYFVTCHGMLDDWSMAQKALKKRLFMWLLGKRFFERAAAVHVTAEGEKRQSAKWFPKGIAFVVPYVFDLTPYENLRGPERAREVFKDAFPKKRVPTILFLSRLHYKKGLEALIRSAKHLKDNAVQFHLLIAGSGEEIYVSSLERLVANLNLEDQVRFLGFVSGPEKLALYQAVDLFVLPTSQENWGFVLLESLVCGTPVITTKGVDIWPELVESGAATITAQDHVEMARAIQKLIEDEQLAEMRTKARNWALESLSPKKILHRYETMYSLGNTPEGV